jgi:hypothetical protein
LRSRILLFTFLFLLLALSMGGQSSTPHGVQVSWVASSTPGVVYQVFRCTGSCTPTSTWTSLCTLSCGTGVTYLDPAAALLVNTTYSYEAVAIDSNGNLSGPSNIATVTVGASFPVNPAPPSGCNAKVQ